MDYDGSFHDTRPGYLPGPAAGLAASAYTRAPKLVAIGGGTGLPVVLSGLADGLRYGTGAISSLRDHLTAIVTVTDDGGSSGWVRRELGVLPPGDIRNCLAALSASQSPLAAVLRRRFVHAEGMTLPAGCGGVNPLSGQSVGNLVLAALTQMTGDFASAVDELARLLETRGRVLPSTDENVRLVGEFDDGDRVAGETAIVERRGRIRRVTLDRQARPLPDALRALVNADGIVVGPGSLFTSVLPNLLVAGIAPTLFGINAVRIFVANLMTQPGETDGFTLEDHLRVIRQHVGVNLFDYVIVNTRPLTPGTEAAQRLAGAEPVRRASAEWHDTPEIVEGDFVRELPDGSVRHDPAALAAAILSAVKRGR